MILNREIQGMSPTVSVAEWIKNMALPLYTNSTGQLILREPAQHRFASLYAKRNTVLENNHAWVCYSSLLHPDMRIQRLPLDSWAQSELLKLPAYQCQADIVTHLDQLVASLNCIPLLLLFYGDVVGAQFVCQKTILFFAQLAERLGKNSLLGYVVQPWINLGRLDRLMGKSEAALKKFQCLHDRVDGAAGVEAILQTALQLSDSMNAEQLAVVKHCAVLEPIKSLLVDKAYAALLVNYGVQANESAADPAISLMTEAVIIAYMQQNAYAEALALALAAYDACLPALLPVYLFRLVELSHIFGESEIAKNEALKLYHLYSNMLASNADYHELPFAFELSLLLHKLGLNTEAEQLIFAVLVANEVYNDELGVIQCLERAIIIVSDSQRTAKLTQQLSDMTQRSHYFMIRKKFCHTVLDSSSITQRLIAATTKIMRLI